jgi:hypothetical protein
MQLRSPRRSARGRGRIAAAVGVIGLTTTLVVAAVATPASATYYSGGMPSRTFNVKPTGINDTWVGFLDTARGNWNATSAGTHIGRSSSAAANFTAGRYSASWYGLYSPHGIRGINRTFTIQVNARTLEADSGANFTKWILSTSTHELGHSVSLADDPSTSAASLMKHSRNRTTVQKPTAYDISEVLRIY